MAAEHAREQARQLPRPPAVDSLAEMVEIAKVMKGVAAKCMEQEKAKGEKADFKLLMYALKESLVAWDRVTEYYRPKMAAVAHTFQPLDLSRLNDDELSKLVAIVSAAAADDTGAGAPGAGPTLQ